jgi:hypothetical protein
MTAATWSSVARSTTGIGLKTGAPACSLSAASTAAASSPRTSASLRAAPAGSVLRSLTMAIVNDRRLSTIGAPLRSNRTPRGATSGMVRRRLLRASSS